jgi:hypothetical protein
MSRRCVWPLPYLPGESSLWSDNGRSLRILSDDDLAGLQRWPSTGTRFRSVRCGDRSKRRNSARCRGIPSPRRHSICHVGTWTAEPSVNHRPSSRQHIERARRLADGLIQTRYSLFNIRIVEPVPFNRRKGWQEWWSCAVNILGQVAASRLTSSPTRLRPAWRSH